ncbi:MAG: TIGR04255 family protein [Cyanobacteria bacterium J06560_6]
MQLPDPERVIYERNPLVEVIGQLRFPPILKIANADPVQLQDAIRDDYPLLETINNVVLIGPGNQPISEPQKVEVTYRFSSEDLKWQVSLNKGFLSIATKGYERYEDFKQRFRKIITIFEDIYKPAFYSRIGLRYQDLIIRSSLDLADEDWSALIPNHIAPELHIPELVADIAASTKVLMMNSGSGQVAFRHGLVEARDSGENLIEQAYLIDADFFNEERISGETNVWEKLDEYNHSARKLFRWSISDTLHAAMRPTPVESTNAQPED